MVHHSQSVTQNCITLMMEFYNYVLKICMINGPLTQNNFTV